MLVSDNLGASTRGDLLFAFLCVLGVLCGLFLINVGDQPQRTRRTLRTAGVSHFSEQSDDLRRIA
jgi:hypothetical protein